MIYLVLTLHWISDFVLQTDKMAQGKSKSNKWLTYHILAYSAPFFVLLGPKYALANGAAHWLIDWATSRINSKLWANKEVHYFFVGVGFDQLLHAVILIATLPLAKVYWWNP